MTVTDPHAPGFTATVNRLRLRLDDIGLSIDEIASALASELRLRPRAAYRYACGLSGQAVADRYNTQFGTPASPSPMSKTRISEYENWPIGTSTRKPSPTVLANLAALYRTSPRHLLDHHDLAVLTDQQRQHLLTPRTVPAFAVTHSKDQPPAPAGPCNPQACAHSEGPNDTPGTWQSSTEEQLIMAAARQAGDHSGRDGAGNLDDATLEQLADHVHRLAHAYLTGPMQPLFSELVRIRNRAYDLLERTQRLPQRADLYLVAGQLSCLLAGTSCDLGYPAAAMEQARAARTYAELIGHPSLWAYASGMLSTFHSLQGQHQRALRDAHAGLARLETGNGAVRLHGLEALAASRLGHEQATSDALTAAVRARDQARGDDDIHDLTGGMFTSTPAKHAYMAAMAHTNLSHPQDTITEATRAIELWTTGPAEECAGSALIVARIDILVAHLLMHDLDAAQQALQPILQAPIEQRTTIVVKRLDSLEQPLRTSAASRSTIAQSMADQIEDFRAAAATLQLPNA